MEWRKILQEFLSSSEGNKLKLFVEDQRKTTTVYPDKHDMLRVFRDETCPFKDIKMVIVGQDPYYNGSADGFAFSSRSKTTPDSLKNIFKELKSNLYSYMSDKSWNDFMGTNSLENWAKQGILLINTVLTVEKDKPNSHKGQGWEILTSRVIELLGKEERPIVFMLWGQNAKEMKPLITGKQHLILESPHPSPLSASKGFFGNEHFRLAQNFYKDSEYYDDMLKRKSLDLRAYVDIDKILEHIKNTVGEGKIPYDNPKDRLNEVRRILENEFLMEITYMFNYSTKT